MYDYQVHGRDQDFARFAEAVTDRLVHTAYLLCRDWHLAQDLAQSTLTKTYLGWQQVSQVGNVEAYTRKILLRLFLDHRRVLSNTEIVTAEIPPLACHPQHELRIALLAALDHLPARDRTILLLRYWEDQSVQTVAELLQLPAALVKTRSFRALAKLRVMLAGERADLFGSSGAP